MDLRISLGYVKENVTVHRDMGGTMISAVLILSIEIFISGERTMNTMTIPLVSFG
jgi:hypothetical protein